MGRSAAKDVGRRTATVAGLALVVGPILFFYVFSSLVQGGTLAIGPNDPAMEALEAWAFPALWGSLLGLPLLAYGRSLSPLATVGLLLGGVGVIVIAWFFIVGIFFGGVSGNPF